MVDNMKGLVGKSEEWPERVDVSLDMSRDVVLLGMARD